MSTSLLKQQDQKNLSQQQRKSKVVSDTKDEDENEKFIQLFPKCKPRLSSSPSERSSTRVARKSMDCNANSGRGSISPKQFNKNNVNSFTGDLDKTSVPKTYPGSVRQVKSENCGNNKHKGQRERRMDVSSTNMPDSFSRLYAAGDSPPSPRDLEMENSSANVTPNMQNSMFLRDSRIEIAGGRELYSHSRNKTGRRIKEQQLRTVPGPQQQEEVESGEVLKEDRTEESSPKQTNESTTSHVNQSLIRECQAYNPHPVQREHPDQARSRHSFSGYGYSPFSSASSEAKSDLTKTKAGRAIGGIARRSRTATEFPPTSFPNTHAAPLTLKETVFGSEITSIEKSISGGVTDKPKPNARVADSDNESDKPYIYETSLGTSCGDGEIVFDDIDECELDERHYSSETLRARPVITKDNYSQEIGKSKRGDEDNTSPSGYESDECSPPSCKVKSSSPNGNKRLIGTLPIADYERSPKRYGLSSRQMDTDQAIRKQRVPSPNNLVPKMPGFPQRVTHLDADAVSPNPAAVAVQLESRLPHNLPVTATSPSVLDRSDRKEFLGITSVPSAPSNSENNKSNEDPGAMISQSEAHCSHNNPASFSQAQEDSSFPNKEALSIPSSSVDPYLYEFSETKKVLEEFFKGGGAVGASYNTVSSNEIDYVLRRQAGNSYVGQRLAADVSLVEESPKLPPRRGGREVVMSLDLNPKSPCAGNGSSLRLITFHEVSRTSNSPISGEQGDANSRDVNDNDIETGSTNTETDLGDTEIGLQVGRTRNFTLSPETTDCDSNELESEMSLDYEASVHSSSKVGGTMPILEDGLSSGNVSETEDENVSRGKALGPKFSTINTKTVAVAAPNSSIVGPQNLDSTSNPTVLLMKKQISEIEKEIRLRANQQHQQQNGVAEPCDMSSASQVPQPQPGDIASNKSSNASGQPQIRVSETEEGTARFDSNDPELEALDPMRRTPPPSPAPGSAIGANAISELLKSSTHPTSTVGELPEYSGANSTTVTAALKDIKEAIQRTKHLHHNSYQVPQIDSTHTETSTFSSSQEARDRISSPVWVPRKSSGANLHRHERLCREGPTSDARLREPLLRKSRYEETGVDDVSDADTDQETDRLLGQNRTDDDYGFYDEKEKDGVKKKRSKEVLIEGVLFRARYLGSTQLECEGQPTKATRMIQAEEAVSRIKAPEGETQPSTEVDLFISTEKIMVLNTDLKEIMMDHALRTISYIADIGDLVVLMARRRPIPTDTPDDANKLPRPPKMICHVFESDEAQYIAQSIGQAFQVAYMEFLKANGIEDHSFVREMDYQEVLNSQEIFGDELQMFAKKELQKDVVVPKTKGEILGVVIVESGWGSMLPTVVIANLAPGNPAARCGQLNIGDQIIAINGVSLVGLPLSTCQNYIKNSKTQNVVKLTVVPCPPVVEVKIKRPDTKYQLGFSVQNGVICSLLRGGIAERGGVRVGHRIIEINNQSVVAVPHEKIVNLLATSVGEINMKTMPTSMFRLLTGQETPLYI